MADVIRWQLELGGEVVARIDADEYAFPFTYGRLVDSPGFERFRRYFTDPEGWPDDDQELEQLCAEERARGGFVLREVTTGLLYGGVTLNHGGAEFVWFRHGNPV